MLRTKFTGFVCRECGEQLHTGVAMPVNEHQITVEPCDCVAKKLHNAICLFKEITAQLKEDAQAELRVELNAQEREPEYDEEWKEYLSDCDTYDEMVNFLESVGVK